MTAKKKVAVEAVDVDEQVAEWVAKAPAIRGLRRPGTRMKAIALMQKMESKGVLAADKTATTEDVGDLAEFIADIDELLGTLGGAEYIEWIERIPLNDGLQVAVLIETFSSKIAPDLGKG